MWISHLLSILLIIMALSVAGCASKPTATPSLPPEVSVTSTSTPVLETVKGTFGNQIRILEDHMPRANSENYVVPTSNEQKDFSQLASMLFTDHTVPAADIAMKNNYELMYYVDRGDDYAVSYLLRERRPVQNGWGLYAIRLDSASNIIVEAPHPLYDKRTPTVALDVYRALDARALLIAGAHRNANGDKSADVAHAAESIFQTINIRLTQDIQSKSGDVIILQIHGFHSSNHEGYPQVVFGLGETPLPKELEIAQKIKDALSEQGIRSGICSGTNSELQDLCAKTNVQGAVTHEGAFIHIELDEKLRKHDEAFIAALVEVFGN